ncbi:hypothetical protein K474DRAFT_1594475 [Panus rudis PR-1116 ss-1]|nr:hypothetical protein K474DRAFT_1594475 [Panus rudis PR-1116 ss-1]
MADQDEQRRPAWQTDELEDEWIDQDEHSGAASAPPYNTSDISFTQAIGSVLAESIDVPPSHTSQTGTIAHGTFLIREDVPAAPILPKTPGRNKKNPVKDIFSPLALERMFEPPSPPQASSAPLPTVPTNAPPVPSRLSQETTEGPVADGREEEGDNIGGKQGGLLAPGDGEAPSDFQFTFSAPRPSPFNPNGPIPNAHSTPGPAHQAARSLQPPGTDPRLRLFQFNYDTFTRDHLSALVDSIAVNTPSGNSLGTPQTMGTDSIQGTSRVSDQSTSRLRSAKRVKLSPASEYSPVGDGAAVIMRPPIRRDYVGESKNLMEKIRQNRDFSTISTTTTTAQTPDHKRSSPGQQQLKDSPNNMLAPPSDAPRDGGSTRSSAGTTNSKRSTYSSLAYREQAANLMAQIRQDVKGSKRLFSADTEASHVLQAGAPGEQSVATSGQASFELDDNPFEGDTEIIDDNNLRTAVGHLDVPQRSGRPMVNLTRFVSSSTASGTTLTAGSGTTLSKSTSSKQITHITPNDIPALPDRVGKMVFDKAKMKWVKASLSDSTNGEDKGEAGAADGSNESEDPFRDIESLRDDDSEVIKLPSVVHEVDEPEQSVLTAELEQSRIEEVPSDAEVDEEEAELNSFSFDGLSMEVAPPLGSGRYTAIEDTDSEEEEEDSETTGHTDSINLDSYASNAFPDDIGAGAPESPSEPALQDSPPHRLAPASTDALSTPAPSRTANHTHTPVIRSAMKSSSVTPVSALKDPSRNRMQTPANRPGHRRSVSFSDGKHDGPIIGIGRNAPTPDVPSDTETEKTMSAVDRSKRSTAPSMSARTRRIADMLDDLDDSGFDDDSPSKASSARPPTDELQPINPRRPSSTKAVAGSPSREIARRVFSGRADESKSPRTSGRNATFLTECSFGVAHDRLVQVITDVQPFEPHWEDLSSIDLSGQNLDSVARLKEFLPRLDSLWLNSNQLSWLSGVPSTVRTLSVANNCSLLNLESLDISNNNIDSLLQLECLRHLRELRADGNNIESIDGLHKMDGLVKLSLQRNCIRTIDLADCRWTRLEMLNLSHNRLGTIEGLSSLPALVALNLDNNLLSELVPNGAMPRLRILRVSGNRLQQLNASPFPNLRTLYADNNSLGPILKAHRLAKLENLSLRNQSGRAGL